MIIGSIYVELELKNNLLNVDILREYLCLILGNYMRTYSIILKYTLPTINLQYSDFVIELYLELLTKKAGMWFKQP